MFLENLEPRNLFSAYPLSISQVSVPTGTELEIVANNTSTDRITVNQTYAGIDITVAGFADQIIPGSFSSISVYGNNAGDYIAVRPTVKTSCSVYGGSGNDTLIAGCGSDSLWGGGGNDSLVAGGGNDTLVSVGDNAASLVGGSGFDSFWADAKSSEVISNITTAETKGGNIHQISSFLESGATLAATTAVLFGKTVTLYSPPSGTAPAADPTANGTYASIAGDPLFSSNGPLQTDVTQGQLGDCYLMSSLAAVAATNPNQIRQSIMDLGDGTYAVRFTNPSGVSEYVRINGTIPIVGGSTYYAALGPQNSTWVALMEKAYAVVGAGSDTYDSIAGGDSGVVIDDLGAVNSAWTMTTPTSASQIMSQMSSDLLKGAAATYTMGDHVYMVSSVDQSTGIITLYNPWGFYTTISAADAVTDFEGYAAGIV